MSLTAGSNASLTFETIPRIMAQDARPDSNEEIGKRLRLIRIAFGIVQGGKREMSQAEMGRLTGVGRQAWNNAETGDNRLGLDNAMLVCRRTGSTLDYIYFGNPNGVSHALAREIGKLENPKTTQKRA